MAFTLQNWARASVSALEPSQTLTSGVVIGCFREYNYFSPIDTQATVEASGYFNSVAYDIATDDLVRVFSFTENTYVTYQLVNTSGVITAVQIGAATSKGRLALTAAQLIAGYAAPIAIPGLAALGANLMYSNVFAQFSWTYGSAQFTTGGNLGIQYGNTVNLGGVKATSVFTNTQVNGIAANSVGALIPVTVVPTASANVVNQGLFLSNDTAAFAVGTGTTLIIEVQAQIVLLT